MSHRRRTGRLQVEGLERRDVPCAAFGGLIAGSAREPAPFNNLGALVSLVASQTQGINNEFAQIKGFFCAGSEV